MGYSSISLQYLCVSSKTSAHLMAGTHRMNGSHIPGTRNIADPFGNTTVQASNRLDAMLFTPVHYQPNEPVSLYFILSPFL
jgi:hypothetical protein